MISRSACSTCSCACRRWAAASARNAEAWARRRASQIAIVRQSPADLYIDRSGHFTWSAINNGNGTTSFFGRNGNFTGSAGSAGSSNDRALNVGRGR